MGDEKLAKLAAAAGASAAALPLDEDFEVMTSDGLFLSLLAMGDDVVTRLKV